MVRHNTDTTLPTPPTTTTTTTGVNDVLQAIEAKIVILWEFASFRHTEQEMGRMLRTVAHTSTNMRGKVF